MELLNYRGKLFGTGALLTTERLFLPRRNWVPRIIFLIASIFAHGAQGEAFKEYEVKAAFLYHFAQFVEWPPEAFTNAATPLVIGILGSDPFGKTLDDLAQNEIVKNRKLVVQRYRRVEEVGTCHILFISQSEDGRLNQIIPGLKGKNVLTVSDMENFVSRGGIIRLLTEKNKVKVRIDPAAAKAANLTISSKLLRIAELVGPRGADR